MTITIITGWIATILLFFNFATCLVMPWSKKKISDCPENEKCKGKGCHSETLCKYHKPFVILSIIAIIAHIVAAIIS